MLAYSLRVLVAKKNEALYSFDQSPKHPCMQWSKAKGMNTRLRISIGDLFYVIMVHASIYIYIAYVDETH
jgi:hypothetical protein